MSSKFESQIEQAKRTANSQTVLSYVAAGFLLLFGYFWYSVWAFFLGTRQVLSPEGAITVVLTLCYTVVWPLFGSMMIPNSPARHFLQKQTWAVPGSIAVIAVTMFLGYFAARVFYFWMLTLAAETKGPIGEDAGVFFAAVVGVFVGAFFVPVICWATATPEQVVAQIQQALWIKDMERAQQLRMRGWAAADLRAQAITHAARLNGVMTLEQGRELSGLMLASHRTLQRGLRMVALTMDDQAKIEDLIPTTPDNELVKLYRELPLQLAAADEVLSEAVAQIDDQSAVVESREPHVSAHVPQRNHVDSLSGPVQTRDAQQGRAVQSTAERHVDSRMLREDQEARDLWRRLDRGLPDVVMAKNIQSLMQWQDITPAKRLIARLVDIGILEPTGPNRPGRYSRVGE